MALPAGNPFSAPALSNTVRAVLTLAVLLTFQGLSVGKAYSQEGERSLKRRNPLTWSELFDGQTLEGWTVVEEADFRHHGKVLVDAGELVLKPGAPATGIRLQDEPPRENYELSLQARRVQGSDFFCGLTFPVGDSLCTWIVGGWGGHVVGLSNVNGRHAAENETGAHFEFENGRWYELRLRVTKLAIDASIDDKEVIRLSRKERKFDIWEEQRPLAPLGIAAWQTETAIKRIRIRALEPSVSEGD